MPQIGPLKAQSTLNKIKFQKFSFKNYDPLRIFSDICVTLN